MSNTVTIIVLLFVKFVLKFYIAMGTILYCRSDRSYHQSCTCVLVLLLIQMYRYGLWTPGFHAL